MADKNTIQRACRFGRGELILSTLKGASVGTFSSVTSGYGVPLSSTQTYAFRSYADDNGAVMTGSLRNFLARTLVTVDQTSGVSLRSVMGHIKLKSGVDFSSADSVVAPVEAYLEQAGNSSYSGRTSMVRAYLDAATYNVTVASGGVFAGVLSEIRCTGTLTATGKMAGFMTRSQSNESGYKKWPIGAYFPADSVTEGINVGTNASTAGSGIALSASAATAGNRFYADDGGVALTAGDYRSTVSRMLVSTAISTGDITIGGFVGQLKVVANVASSAYLSGVRGYVEVSGASISSASGVRSMIDVPSGATIASGDYASAFLATSNDMGGTHTGKAVIMDVRNPLTGDWDAFLALPTTSGVLSDTGAGGGTSKYLKVLINGVAYSILVKSDA